MADPTPILGTNVASAIVPFTDADTFPTHHSKYGKGGWKSVQLFSELEQLPEQRIEDGMVVFVVERQTAYTYNLNNGTWEFFAKGGDNSPKRVTVEHTVENLFSGQIKSFQIEMAKSSIVYDLRLSKPAKITAWSSPDKTETNPYVFLATEEHLVDDGSTLLSDGTIIRSRRYSIFVNLEEPATNTIYFDIENIDLIPGDVTVSITYLPVEKSAEY